MPGGHPDLQGILSSLLAPGMIFMLVFSPHNHFPLRGFLEVFFSVGISMNLRTLRLPTCGHLYALTCKDYLGDI